jgi:hypothetical protein
MQSIDSNQDEVVEVDDIEADIAASIEKLSAPKEPETPQEPAAADVAEVEQPVEVEKPKLAPPSSYTATVKEKWDTLDPVVQAELVKREEEVHRMLTSPTGELNFGRAMKETIAPYLPIIQAEGGTPETAVKDLLNTAYILRQGTPQQKQQVVKSVCEQFGIDFNGAVGEQEYVDPTIQSLQQEIAQLKQLANPDTLIKQLQETQERSNVQKEADAFARDPANKYFDKVRPFMAAFLGEGVAKDYKEAYEMACNAHPEVRSILESERKAAEQEKRKTELRAKQNAASSIVGSPATAVSNTNSQTDDIESAVRAAMRAATGAI